eukprot:gnl/MRDRNA2_/MRDRNA2_115456_c0_seq1.p1 gnl/MRDRNA2_/MRDRNA2_115456_c0~~gnl/MRDRNA2_/MRDRNA2_115456_c0_seq1.p1  ORF type:complete len:472 (+),score=73.18 gnl/MRDRNA2_/MRDRNA2_115456_c0_seq1:157-1416(+)
MPLNRLQISSICLVVIGVGLNGLARSYRSNSSHSSTEEGSPLNLPPAAARSYLPPAPSPPAIIHEALPPAPSFQPSASQDNDFRSGQVSEATSDLEQLVTRPRRRARAKPADGADDPPRARRARAKPNGEHAAGASGADGEPRARARAQAQVSPVARGEGRGRQRRAEPNPEPGPGDQPQRVRARARDTGVEGQPAARAEPDPEPLAAEGNGLGLNRGIFQPGEPRPGELGAGGEDRARERARERAQPAGGRAGGGLHRDGPSLPLKQAGGGLATLGPTGVQASDGTLYSNPDELDSKCKNSCEQAAIAAGGQWKGVINPQLLTQETGMSSNAVKAKLRLNGTPRGCIMFPEDKFVYWVPKCSWNKLVRSRFGIQHSNCIAQKCISCRVLSLPNPVDDAVCQLGPDLEWDYGLGAIRRS